MTPIMRQIINAPTLVKNRLLAHYDFIQGADTQVLYDKSGNGFNGTLGSTSGSEGSDPTWASIGASFDGGDYINCGKNAGLDCPQGITVSIIFSLTAGYSGWQWLFTKNKDAIATNGYFMAISSDAGTPARFGVGGVTVDLPLAPVAGKYYCLTGVGVPGFLPQIFQNGILAATGVSAVTTINAAIQNLCIGKTEYYSSPLITGNIAYIVVYNRGLSAREIQQNYKYLKRKVAQRGITLVGE